MRYLIAAALALAVASGPDLGLEPSAQSLGGATLKRIAAIDVPGPPGRRFDYLAIDYDDHYLLSAHLGAGLL